MLIALQQYLNLMFENRSDKQLIAIYVIIALLFSLGFTAYNLSPYSSIRNEPIMIVVIANVLFFCMFYFLYWPLKLKKKK